MTNRWPDVLAIGAFADRWKNELNREVDIKLKIDTTPIDKLEVSKAGQIEFYRDGTKQ